ncbi:MAG: hypothetical protein Q7P63_12210, partial [Verrucomicrobiota bacterium JB022]|nr:hypothetical protein [Verrucomicrobiota bacterium JB022]
RIGCFAGINDSRLINATASNCLDTLPRIPTAYLCRCPGKGLFQQGVKSRNHKFISRLAA